MAHDCAHCKGAERLGLSRRTLMQGSIGGFFGFAMARQAELFGAPNMNLFMSPQGARKTKSVIVLWMSGGPTQYETWDPKQGQKNGGPTKAINTSVKGIQYAQNMRMTAKQAKHISVVRSITSREGSHGRGRYLLHTGYARNGTVIHPSMGAVTAMELGDTNADLPNFISIRGRSESAGFLPPQYNPLLISSPDSSIPNLKYPGGVDKARFRQRIKFLEEQEKLFAKGRPTVNTERHKTAYEKADRLMHTPLLEAFDLKKEKAELVKEYTGGDAKNTRFGKSCLLARRLVERGVKFVEIDLGGWDTHNDNFNKVSKLCKQLDPGMATLIKDLQDRRMLDSTMVLWMGEFGRTPKINKKTGRDHYPKVWSIAMAGGGIQGGRAIGSSGKDGVEVKDRPVTVPDLFSTIYAALGVDYKKQNISPLGRPIRLAEKGTPVKELLS